MIAVAPLAGLLLGFLDFVWIKYVPYPLGGLGNSTAVWAVAAFLLTRRSRWSLPASVLGGVVMLVVAVPAYYLAAALIQNDELSNAYASYALIWMAMGVLAGAIFGAGGHLARVPGRRQRVAIALPGAVLFAEAAIELRRAGDPSYGVAEPLLLAAILIALGLVVSRRALLLTVPLAALGFVVFSLTGFR
ncbi:DUF6518 family protein [Paractinoplanes rhizophilus]|uniref:DUF6518 family protein n=1 Tax=Paractinoplanes rhizophilus TaxID=1416877 RepID=A0ABW2HTC2_9ACTN